MCAIGGLDLCVHTSQLAGLGELPLLGVDGLAEDLVPRRLGLHQLEPLKITKVTQ